MIATRPMPIHRSWLRTLAWLLIMLLLLGLAAFMGFSGEHIIAGLLALFGLLSMMGVGSGSYITDCPVCGKQLRGLIGLKRCPQCFSYGKVCEGQYYELEPDFVNHAPLLALPLGDHRDLPPLCCACGAPAVRTDRLRIIRVEFAFDLNVPHCALHTGGADLASESTAGKGAAQAPVLKVKSYAFYKACIKKNFPDVTKYAGQTNESTG